MRTLLIAAFSLTSLLLSCVPAPEQSCIDGIKNYDEEDVDCGPTCKPCVFCTDGIKNRDEEAVDCGGSYCPKCHCFNKVKDGNESDIDCGGDCTLFCDENPCTPGQSYRLYIKSKNFNSYSSISNVQIINPTNSYTFSAYIDNRYCNFSFTGKNINIIDQKVMRYPLSSAPANNTGFIPSITTASGATFEYIEGSAFSVINKNNVGIILFSTCDMKVKYLSDTLSLSFSIQYN